MRVTRTSDTVEGKAVETIQVFDGDTLIATFKKEGSDLAVATVYEAFKPDLKGAVVEIQEGSGAPKPRKFKIGE
jgi:hypothetical protein